MIFQSTKFALLAYYSSAAAQGVNTVCGSKEGILILKNVVTLKDINLIYLTHSLVLSCPVHIQQFTVFIDINVCLHVSVNMRLYDRSRMISREAASMK